MTYNVFGGTLNPTLLPKVGIPVNQTRGLFDASDSAEF